MSEVTTDTVLAERAASVYDRIAALKVTDIQTYVLLGDLLKEVKNVVNKFEEETRPEIKQAHDLHKSLIARTKRWADKFAEAEALGKAKLERFYSEQGDLVVPKIDGIAISETWTGEVTDAALIPRQYMVPDTAKLLALTKTLKDAMDVAGWRTKKVRTVSVRS